MTVREVGLKLVELCKAGKNREAVETLYADDVVSTEVAAFPPLAKTLKGKKDVLGKTDWWFANHEVHSGEVMGPYPNGDRFVVWFRMDVTFKPDKRRMQIEEVGLYTVKNGKIIEEEFFYDMGG